MVIAALALLAGTLIFAPLGSTQGGVATLSPTPPVTLAPVSTTPTTPTGTPRLPKTGLDTGLIALVGLGLLAMGVVLRPSRGAPVSRRSR